MNQKLIFLTAHFTLRSRMAYYWLKSHGPLICMRITERGHQSP